MSYSSPTELTAALDVLKGGGLKVIAGGTDVYPAIGQGQCPKAFLDITRIEGFAAISHGSFGTRFGAAVTWSDVVRADLPSAFDALKAAAGEVGSVQIQNAGTVAGNLCNASPAADGVPPLLILDARVEMASAARGSRELPLADFLKGSRQTALAPDEIVTAIIIPPPPDQAASAFEKLGNRRYLVISITMTAAMVTLDEAGRIGSARIAVGACSTVAKRLPGLEADLQSIAPDEVEVRPEHLAPLSPIDDLRGTGAYRLEAVAEQCRRAIRRAARP